MKGDLNTKMREFIYYSRTAPTTGNFGTDLMKAGRIDIAIHTVIAAFFLSHSLRNNVKLHLVFTGQPDPPKHLELLPITEGKTGVDKIYLSKKDVSGLIKRMLYKYKKDKKTEVFPGYFIEKKGIINTVKELSDKGRNIYILDSKGEDIRKTKIGKDPIFILGDHSGITDKKELKRLKKMCEPISIGNKTYFASQTVTIVHNELDRREESSKL
jgi:tRNA (pseudouridine54-N1)-methyltransferase